MDGMLLMRSGCKSLWFPTCQQTFCSAFLAGLFWWRKLPCRRSLSGKGLRVASGGQNQMLPQNPECLQKSKYLSPTEPSDETTDPGPTFWLQPCERDQEAQDTAKMSPYFWHTENSEILGVCCYNLLNLGVIHNLPIDNEYMLQMVPFA